MAPKTTILRCTRCGTLNRVLAEKLVDRPKCGSCSAVINFPRAPVEGTSANFDDEVMRWPGTVLVEFWGPWCSHCRTLAPILDELAAGRAGLFKIVKVNIHAEQTLAARFNILSVPTLILYRNGARIKDLPGAPTYMQLLQWIGPL